MEKLFKKFVKACQSESEFVNHSVAASNQVWLDRYRVEGLTTFGGGKGDEYAGSTD
jgi:hypothetical protein